MFHRLLSHAPSPPITCRPEMAPAPPGALLASATLTTTARGARRQRRRLRPQQRALRPATRWVGLPLYHMGGISGLWCPRRSDVQFFMCSTCVVQYDVQ